MSGSMIDVFVRDENDEEILTTSCSIKLAVNYLIDRVSEVTGIANFTLHHSDGERKTAFSSHNAHPMTLDELRNGGIGPVIVFTYYELDPKMKSDSTTIHVKVYNEHNHATILDVVYPSQTVASNLIRDVSSKLNGSTDFSLRQAARPETAVLYANQPSDWTLGQLQGDRRTGEIMVFLCSVKVKQIPVCVSFRFTPIMAATLYPRNKTVADIHKMIEAKHVLKSGFKLCYKYVDSKDCASIAIAPMHKRLDELETGFTFMGRGVVFDIVLQDEELMKIAEEAELAVFKMA